MAGVEIIIPTEEDRLAGRKKIQKKISDEQIRKELHELEVKVMRIRNSSAFKSKQICRKLNFDAKLNGEFSGTTMDATTNKESLRDKLTEDTMNDKSTENLVNENTVCTYDSEVVSIEGTEAGGRLNNIAPND